MAVNRIRMAAMPATAKAHNRAERITELMEWLPDALRLIDDEGFETLVQATEMALVGAKPMVFSEDQVRGLLSGEFTSMPARAGILE